MTDNNHPITPPDELVEDWWEATQKEKPEKWVRHLATQAARWGADMELEACCKWLDFNYPHVCITMLRADRRPEPPSLKEQALQALDCLCVNHTKATAHENTIRRALEQLDD